MIKAPILYMVYQTNPFHEDQGGGVRYVKNLTEALGDEGVKIVFFGVGGVRREEGNICFIPLMSHPNNTFLFMLALFWARFRYIGFSEAIVHVHRLYYVVPFLGSRIKCVATLHGRTFSVFPKRFGQSISKAVFPIFSVLERALLRRVNRVVAVSADVLEQFSLRHGKEVGCEDLDVIPSMVNPSEFCPTTTSHFCQQRGSGPLCLFVGRLAQVKNVPLLLESWKILVDRLPDAQLLLVGDGELRSDIEQRISDMGLGGAVDMLGKIPPSEVAAAFGAAQLLVLTSHHEASPTVIKEALLCGVPVVSTPVGDVANVIEEGRTGRIVAPDASALADAMCDVLEWKMSRDEIAITAKASMARYLPLAVARRYLEIYRKLGYLHPQVKSLEGV